MGLIWILCRAFSASIGVACRIFLGLSSPAPSVRGTITPGYSIPGLRPGINWGYWRPRLRRLLAMTKDDGLDIRIVTDVLIAGAYNRAFSLASDTRPAVS